MKRKHFLSLLLILLFSTAFLITGCTDNPQGEQTEQNDEPQGPCVLFDFDSGFYDSDFSLSLECNVEGAAIYYTLDGSTPDATSSLYTEPIKITNQSNLSNRLSAIGGISASNNYIPNYNITKGTVLRAVAVLPDNTSTEVASRTYFVGIDRKANYGDVPVISLVTDMENFYDYETGIYCLGKTYDDWLAHNPNGIYLDGWQRQGNYSNRGKEWERPISVEYLSSDGSEGFLMDMGVRIMGGASRNQSQKSLKFIAREEYGRKSLKFELIPDNYRSDGTEILTKYKSFILRNGGNDADFARVRDPYLQSLVAGCDFETQSSTPCVVFLNGEYWGMYAITEDYSDNYFENNYGVDKDNVVLVKRGEIEDGLEEDIELFKEMYYCITMQDMSIDAFYEEACALLDMQSFIEYCAFELYVNNQDSFFENNNWRMWRVRQPEDSIEIADGKWRMVAYDTDYSTGIYDNGENYKTNNILPKLTPSSQVDYNYNLIYYHPIELFHSLMENDSFRDAMILALCDMRNICFETKRANAYLDAIAEDYLLLMPETFHRFGPDWIAQQDTAKYIETEIKELRIFMNGRYLNFMNTIKRTFQMEDMKRLNVMTEDPSMGTVRLNHHVLDLTEKMSAMYFEGQTLTLTALPQEGYRFVRWETTSDLITDKTAPTVSFSFSGYIDVAAVFEPIS